MQIKAADPNTASETNTVLVLLLFKVSESVKKLANELCAIAVWKTTKKRN
jgi:hypothetical protein